MVKRIVIMDLLPETEDLFLELYDQVKKEIRAQEGCKGLELLSTTEKTGSSFCTISLWQSADALETYRTSALFRKTWSSVKPLFAHPARAWTLSSIDIQS